MSPDSPRARRAGLRLLAAAATGLIAAGGLAAPAAAEIPGITGDPAVNFSLPESITAGESIPRSITIDYTPAAGSESATHIVGAELTVTGSAEVIELTAGSEDPNAPVGSASCDASVAYTVTCTDSEADANTVFGFDLAAVASAASETFGYTLKVTIDGTEVATRSGTFDVVSTYDVHNPYAHGNIEQTGVKGGTNAAVNPVVYQHYDLAPTAAAVVVEIHDPAVAGGLDTSDLASAVAPYDNCRVVTEAASAGAVCVITEVPDVKGQFLTLTGAVNYAISANVVGPLDICGCTYSFATVDAETLAADYSFLDDTEMDGPFVGLTTTTTGWTGAAESIAFYEGRIDLVTADNSYDLVVKEINLNGKVGGTATVTTSISNIGTADADDLDPTNGSYLVRAQLPQGTELVRVDSNGGGVWDCLSGTELEAAYAGSMYTSLEWWDFGCVIEGFDRGETATFKFTVKLTDTSAYEGAIEIGSTYLEDEFEGDFESDFALIYNNAVEHRNDYNRDGYEDLFVIRKSDGALRFYPGTSSGNYGSATTVATGWGGMDIVMAGDLTGDNLPDLIARTGKTGTLYTYPGNGSGGFNSRITVGTGWNKMGQIAVGNFDGDGAPDIFAVPLNGTGDLFYYPGLGNGKFGAREDLADGWNGWDVITSVGDVDGDGFDDFLSRWNGTGYYYIYTFNSEPYVLDQSLYDWVYNRRYDQVVGAGDFTLDGKPEIISTDLKTGQLVRRTFNLKSPTSSTGTSLGSGWNAMELPVVNLDRTYDVDYDGYADVVAQRKSDGDLRLYWGTGSGLVSPWNMCDDCDGITWASAGGDYNSDGRTDMLIRNYEGGLYVVPGMDQGEQIGFDESIKAGTGWNGYGYITGGFDHNSDGRDDMIARQNSTGYLYLYPGRGDGTFGSRVKIGSGWNAMRDISAVGDLDHDGRMDLLAMRSSTGCLYFYGGNGNGTIKNGVAVSCSWGGYDQITGVGDFDHDGHADWLARRKSDGALFLYPGNGAGGMLTRKQIGSGWNSMSYLA